MKVRIWTGRPSLATEQGKEVGTFEAFEAWLAKQPDGRLEVWAGRWWVITGGDAQPFALVGGKAHCSHPSFRSKTGLDTKDFPGFFAFEAWRRGKRSHDFWHGTAKMAASMLDDAKEDAS